MNTIYLILFLIFFVMGIGILAGFQNSNKRNATVVASGILAFIFLLLMIIDKPKSKGSPKPTPKVKKPLQYSNKGLENPSDYGGIYARDGFGNKVDWWFLLKLPSKMMSQDQIQHLKLLPGDYVDKLKNGVYDPTAEMGTNYTKGWLTASISPSTEFIQNWAPMDNHSFKLEITSDLDADKLTPLFEKWLKTYNNGNTANSFVTIKKSYYKQTSTPATPGNVKNNFIVTVSAPSEKSEWNKGLQGPDASPSVNTWRAWLRVVEAINLIKPAFVGGKKTYDISALLNLSTGKVTMGDLSYSKLSGVAYDFTNCATSMNSSFGSGQGDPGNNFVNMCAHCNCNGNDVNNNVWQDLKSTRVNNKGVPIAQWTPTSYNILLQEVEKFIGNASNKIGTQTNNSELAKTITNYIVSTQPGGNNKQEIEGVLNSLSSIIQDIYKDIMAFVNASKYPNNVLYDPTGHPLCGNSYSDCVKKYEPKGPGNKENYTKEVKNPQQQSNFIPYTRGPDCQANYGNSAMSYFLPDWAKVPESNKTCTPTEYSSNCVPNAANPSAPAEVGGGLASVLNSGKRGSSVCYVYADSNNPKLQYFRTVENSKKDTMSEKEKAMFNKNNAQKLDPLGQNANDPVSKTLDQLFYSYRNKNTHWSFWTDQMYEPGDSYVGTANSGKYGAPEFDLQQAYNNPMPGDGREQGTIYPHKGAGCSAPGAHSKGVLCYDDKSQNGFWLSTSVPMFPDVSLTGIGENIRLGCQLDNNSSFAQHLFCCSLDTNAMQEMLKAVKTAMICGLESPTCKVDAISGFNYGYGIDKNYINEEGKKLGMYQCSSTGGVNNPYGRDNKNLNDANTFIYNPKGESQMQIFPKNNGIGYTGENSVLCNNSNNCGKTPKDVSNSLAVIAKAPADNRPPWTVVAQFLETDLSVSGWWDNLNGTPSYCNGLDYSNSTNEFCLNDYRTETTENYSYLNGATPKYNVERIMALTIKDIPNPRGGVMNRSFTQFGKMWYVGNHAKWGISTPRTGEDTNSPKYVILGDMNGGGYPASKICNANQFGRGGTFFVIQSEEFHDSLTDCIELVCACNADGDASKNFCGWGGYPGELGETGFSNDPTYGRIDSWDQYAQFPTGNSSGSFWDKSSGGGVSGKESKAWKRYQQNPTGPGRM